jgi:hypothetical protein
MNLFQQMPLLIDHPSIDQRLGLFLGRDFRRDLYLAGPDGLAHRRMILANQGQVPLI